MNRINRLRHVWTLIFLILFFIPVSAQETTTEQIEKGIVYREFLNSGIPRAVQVLEIDRKNSLCEIKAVLGNKHIIGIEPLDKIINRISGVSKKIIAGINADFYILRSGPFQGDPVGLCVLNGEIVSSPGIRSVFAILANGTPVIDRFEMESFMKLQNGDLFEISGINQECPNDGIVINTHRFYTSTRAQKGSYQVTAGPLKRPLKSGADIKMILTAIMENDSTMTIPENGAAFVGIGKGAEFLRKLSVNDMIEVSVRINPFGEKVKFAVGGTPRLIRNGKISIENKLENVRDSFVTTRHPRTAVGFNENKIFFVTVDGRREGWSAGMNLNELALFMLELGAEEAVNLDGGGSTTMWVNGEIKNRPSDGRVRPVANALLLVKK